MSVTKEIGRVAGWSIVLSVLMIMVGILAIIVPLATGVAVAILVAWLMLLSGAAHVVYAWHTCRGRGRAWKTLLGMICIGTGGYMLLHPMAGLKSLTFVLAVYLLVGSILEFILSFHLRFVSGSGWLLVDGIITLVLAIMIWRTWPASTMWVIGTLVGVSMLFGGVARLMISVAGRRAVQAFRRELHEPEQGH